jgi:iron complex outermembrane recepter protein
MTKAKTLLFILTVISYSSFAQTDTAKNVNLDEVVVRAFEQNRSGNANAAVRIIENNNADRTNKLSLLHGFNSAAGVRMEERSPGSYRINIRGSSLRSPFGVRNVKVYWNNIPITDPGGNTYFNQFAHNNFSYLEIFKGPASSMYGAGTGGLILMHNMDRWRPGASLEYMTGSYNLQNVLATARFGKGENKNQFTYAHNQSDGYREQTAMRRDNVTWSSQLKISDKQQLTASLLFTDMYYETPGALTLAEYNNNPKAARPAGGGFPSAVNARAAIYQKTLTAGFTNDYRISSSFRNYTTLYGAFAQVKNPAIRNYERRNEPSFGGRSVFVYNKETNFQLVAGGEFQQAYFNTLVSKNRNGNPDTMQTNDDINYTTYSVFTQADYYLQDSWQFSAGISLNKTKVQFARMNHYPVLKQSRSYQNELAPRVAIRKLIGDDFSVRASVSRGFSPPTTAELLPSTGIISTDLEAEYGWNYEAALNYNLFNRKLRLEATGFYFKLNNALVQRRDQAGADFFVNAGDIKQKGVEVTADYTTGFTGGVFNYLSIQSAYTYNHFRYGSFIKGSDNFSGKKVPSVPSNSFSTLADLQLNNGIYTNITYYIASKIYLNDANTASAKGYDLLGVRLGWRKAWQERRRINFYGGVDNLLDEKYSLGNDINAAGGRYYNAAPERNYYVGISFTLDQNKTTTSD